MTSREKFEAWYLENWGHTEDDHETLFERDPDSDEEYYRLGVRMPHGAWQASELASQQKLTDMAVQLANAESKCRELAAELHSVKSAHQDAVGTIMNTASRGVAIYTKKPIQISVTTPIYDAFQAEVRAQGVEMYADNLDSGADDAERDGFDDAVKFLRSEASGVRLFAAQLRKGGAL